MWEFEYSAEAEAAPELLYRLWSDFETWHTWNEGVGKVEVHGPFAAGTTFTMQAPDDEDPITMLITEVVENRGFTDVNTQIDGLVITTYHRIEPAGGGRARVTYRTEITGDAADTLGAEVGPQICADFPDVVEGLLRRARALAADAD